MAVTYRDDLEGGAGGASTTSVTLGPPAGVITGDLMIAVIGSSGGSDVPAPAGWTSITYQERVSGGNLATLWVFRRIATADDEAGTSSYVFALSPAPVALKIVGDIYAAQGASPTNPIIGYAGAGSTVAGTTATAPAVATAESGALSLLLFCATSGDASVPTYTPSGGTERADVGTGTFTSIEVVESSADPNTTFATTISTSSSWAAIRLVLAPRYWETPNAGVLVSPVGGVSVVLDEDIDLVGAHSHPDAGDTQSAAEERYKLVGDPSWTTESIVGAGTTHTIPGGTLVAGSYERERRTASSLGKWGPWSASGFFEAIPAPDPPVIVTPADGSTVSATAAGTFTLAATADQSQWRTVADDGAGSPDTGTIYVAATTIAGNGRAFTSTHAVTGRDEHVQVRSQVAGNWTAWASNLVHVAFTPPETPEVNTVADTPSGAITVEAFNPDAADPDLDYNNVWRRESGDDGDGIRIATDIAANGSFVDYAVEHRTSYEYRIEAVADNTASTFSAWWGADLTYDGGIFGDAATTYLDASTFGTSADTILDSGAFA